MQRFFFILAILFCIATFAPAQTLHFGPTQSTVEGHANSDFFDNFDDGNADGWLPQIPSNWEVTPDQGDFSYHLRKPHPTGDEFSVIANRTFRDFDMNLQLRSGDGTAKNVFVLFDMQSYPNGYYLQLSETATILYLTTGGPGTGFEIARNNSYRINDNSYHTIRIVRQGANIKVYGDGALRLDINNGTFLSGQMAIGSFKGTAYFDDVGIQ